MKDILRTFLAINLPVQVKEKIGEILKGIKDIEGSKCVKSENIHLTLKFFGNTNPDQRLKIKEALIPICRETHPFKMTISGFGAFPNQKRPRVIWLGIKDGAKEARALSEQIEKTLAERGFNREDREFKCHLTISRPKTLYAGIKMLEELKKIFKSEVIGEFMIKSIELMKSELAPEGAKYDVIESFQLGKE